MAFYYVKGGTSDAKARAVAYIRDRLPIRPVTHTLYEGYPVKPAFIWLTNEHRLMTNGPLSAFHGDDRAVQVELSVYDIRRMLHCAWLEETIVHAFALEPKYAGLPIDLTVDENQRGFRSNRSAAYCGLHATRHCWTRHGLTADPDAVSLCFDVGLSKVDVGCILSGIVATATRVIEGDAR